MENNKLITRRDFMVFSAASASGLTLGLGSVAHSKEVENLLDPGNPLMLPTNFEPTAFFTMEPSGRTTIHVNKCEMGQHIGTAFAQIVCEELELNWDDANIDYPGFPENIEKLGPHLTASSASTTIHFDELSRAGAAGRIALIEAGSELLDANIEDCVAKNGHVKDSWTGQSISYAQILSQTTIERKFTDEELASLKLKKFDEYNLIGKSVDAIDIPSKINGTAKFGIDAKLPNMVYGAVVPPPTRLGSTVKSFDDSDCKQIKGYIKAVVPPYSENDPLSGWLVVTANSFPAAMRAAKVINVAWNIPERNNANENYYFSKAKNLCANKISGAEQKNYNN